VSIEEVRKGIGVRALTWRVRYRVTGQPDPDAWYLCAASFAGGAAIREVQGQDVTPVGVFEGKNRLVKDAPATVGFTVQGSRAKRKGAYQTTPVGGPVSCPVR
jgi:hypothetical protein